jgi:photosystem II stability/assembly factor-like uncharacterized protein
MNKQFLSILGMCLLGFSAQAQWVSHPIGFASSELVPLYLDAVDANSAWAVGSSAFSTAYEPPTAAHSTDGGLTWMVASLPVKASTIEDVTSLAAISATTAWVTTVEYNGVGGHLLQTTDGGQSWLPQGGTTTFADADSYPQFIRFFSVTSGVAVGEKIPGTSSFETYITTNAGQTWTPVANLPATLANENVVVLPPAVLGSNIWFATSQGRVFHSADMGQTWTVATVAANLLDPTALAFRDAQNGLLTVIDESGTNHELFRTTDGGATWAPLSYTGPLHGFALSPVPGTSQFVSTGADIGNGDQGSSVSRDNGQTWVSLENTVDHLAVEFLSPQVGWSTGIQASGTQLSSVGNRFTGNALATRTDAALQAGLTVSPNPAMGGRFTLQTARATGIAATVRVLDTTGRLVQQHAWNTAAPLALDLAQAPAGLYVLEVQGSSGTARQKVVVQ